MTLKEIPFGDHFYWKGKRYKQVIRPHAHLVTGKFTIVCALMPQGGWVDMPSGRKVKLILRIKNE